MPELHETIMGRKLIEHTLPEIARQLERIADAMEKTSKDSDKLAELKLKYKSLSALDPDPRSTHRMNRQILAEMDKTLEQIKNLES
jgi:hypothetical protein